MSAGGPWSEAARRLRGDRAALAGLAGLAAIAAACALGPGLLGLDPVATEPALRHAPPSLAHWFGTDALGRDLLARVLVGGRTSLLVGLAATAVSVGVGTLYGALSGYAGGRVDEGLMRLVDFLYGVPYMFLVILVMLLFADSARGDPLPVFVALGLVQWLTMARIVRAQVVSLREREFVLAARVAGAGPARILFRHLLPNALGPVIVYATLTVPAVILLESFLSFLGLGVALSWGELVAEGVSVVNPVRSYWWLLAFPSGFLAATLLALNFLGDGLRDALDPADADVTTLLEVDGLSVRFPAREGELRAVEDLSFAIERGEVLGLVGESGCGKSAAALALVDLVPPPGRRAAGRIVVDGDDVTAQGARGFRRLRGRRIGMVFQDATASLNPYLRVGVQLAESARLRGAGAREARARAGALLERVGIPEPGRRLDAWPHQLSGGQRQRVMLAMALLGEPDLLVADEPTTALDVTTQAQILALLRELQRERGLAVLFITHDLAVAAGLCDRIAVLYAGRLVEEARGAALFAHPTHPYTEALLACAPRSDGPRGERLATIEGLPPRLREPARACTFAPRCRRVLVECGFAEPALAEDGARRRRCVLPEDVFPERAIDG